MRLRRARRPDGTFGEIHIDERGRLKVRRAGSNGQSNLPCTELRQTESGELLTVQRSRS
ncbi:MAG: hypothetical protein Q7T82_18205 [Armatimonadota bacterium]|nr:hypothetical protein [Armatimonadota bacterium]